jgi:hypothetical protein
MLTTASTGRLVSRKYGLSRPHLVVEVAVQRRASDSTASAASAATSSASDWSAFAALRR